MDSSNKKVVGASVISGAVVAIIVGIVIIVASVMFGVIERVSSRTILNINPIIFYVNLVILGLFGVSFIAYGVTKIRRRVFIFVIDGTSLVFGNVQKAIALSDIKDVRPKKRYRFKKYGGFKHDVVEVTLKNGQIKNFVDIANTQNVVDAILSEISREVGR